MVNCGDLGILEDKPKMGGPNVRYLVAAHHPTQSAAEAESARRRAEGKSHGHPHAARRRWGRLWTGRLDLMIYPLVMTNSLLLNMTIEIVDFPIQNGDFPQLC